MSDDSNDPRVVGGQVEEPLVIFEPDTSRRHYGATDAGGFGYCSVVLRQYGPVNGSVLFIGPRHSLRAMGIVEMGMSVDDH